MSLQPLQIPAIVHEVLDWLPSELLVKCSEVSRVWNAEARWILRRRRAVNFQLDSYTRVDELMCLDPDRRGYYESFRLGPSLLKDSRLLSFFSVLGNSVTRLDLSRSPWGNHASLRKFLSETTPNLESLHLQLLPPPAPYCPFPTWKRGENPAEALYTLWKVRRLHLSLDYTYYWSLEEQEQIKPFLKHLLSGTPNLNSITCPKYPENLIETFQYEVQILFRESPNLRPLLQLLTDPQAPPLPHLHTLNLPLKFWTSIPKLLAKAYPLQSLDWFIGLDVTYNELTDLLNSLASTLKTLSLDFTTASRFHRDSRPYPTFPSAALYTKLTTLSLRSFKTSLAPLVLQIPALKHLNLSKARNLDLLFPQTHFTQSKTYPSLCSLQIDQHNPKDSATPSTLSRIGIVFNALTSLEIRFLSDDSLRAIFSSMPALNQLIAMDGLFTDSGVTGLADPILDTATRNSLGIPTKHLARNRAHPYIASLKNLRRLHLRSKHMTDLSIFYGILDCHNLSSLTLMAYGLTNACLMRLSEVLRVSYLETVFCHQLTVTGAQHIQTNLPHCELRLNQLQKPLNGMDIYRLGLFQSGTPPVQKRQPNITHHHHNLNPTQQQPKSKRSTKKRK